MARLARAHQEQNRWSEAEVLQLKVWGLRTERLGSWHPDTLTAMDGLAYTYQNRGRWAEAEMLNKAVLKITWKTRGPEHLDTLTYRSQQNPPRARHLEVELLLAREKILGPEHPKTLNAMNHFASTCELPGRLSKAEKLASATLIAKRRRLGPEHPDTLASMEFLSTNYVEPDDFHKAEELEVAVLEARKRILGPENPRTLHSMSTLASFRCFQKRLSEAKELAEAVVTVKSRTWGPEHPLTLGSMQSMAMMCRLHGDLQKAEELSVAILEGRKRTLGPEHPQTLAIMANLADIYSSQERQREAEELYFEAERLSKRELEENHPDAAASALAHNFEQASQERVSLGLRSKSSEDGFEEFLLSFIGQLEERDRDHSFMTNIKRFFDSLLAHPDHGTTEHVAAASSVTHQPTTPCSSSSDCQISTRTPSISICPRPRDPGETLLPESGLHFQSEDGSASRLPPSPPPSQNIKDSTDQAFEVSISSNESSSPLPLSSTHPLEIRLCSSNQNHPTSTEPTSISVHHPSSDRRILLNFRFT